MCSHPLCSCASPNILLSPLAEVHLPQSSTCYSKGVLATLLPHALPPLPGTHNLRSSVCLRNPQLCLQLLALGCESSVCLASMFVDDSHEQSSHLLQQAAQRLQAAEPLPGDAAASAQQAAGSEEDARLIQGLVGGDPQQHVQLTVLSRVGPLLLCGI